MFESLRKKFTGWFVKSEEEKTKKKKESKKKVKEKTKNKIPLKKEKKIFSVEKKKTKIIQSEDSQEKKSLEDAPQIEEPEKDSFSFWPFKKNKSSQEDSQEEILPTELEKELTKEEGFFSKIKSKLLKSKLTKEDFEDAFYELEITLLENNTSLETVDQIKEVLSKELVEKDIKKSEIETTILNSLKEAINSVLLESSDIISDIKKSESPYVILFFGINGSGKTTSIAKVANYLKQKKLSVVMAAADTFRAASIEQIQEHANRLNIPLIKHDYGSDPAAVGFDAISYAKKNKIDVVLIDTAGRMYTASNLLREMEKIVKVTNPHLKIFVGESITGNDATDQAKTFNEQIGIDGIILSKADVDEKAGTILSVSYVTKKPIYFLGIGQKYEDLKVFKKEDVLKNLGLE